MPYSSARIEHYAEPPEGYIRKLIAEGEHQQLDFKFGITDSKKIARTLAAFSNTDGGRLLVGVKDNGAIAGVRSEEEYYMVQAASDLYTRPIVPFQVKEWSIEKKSVLEIIILPEKQQLVKAPDREGDYKVFIRVNDENLPVNSVWLKAWHMRNSGEGVVIHYSEKEKLLLDFLSNNPGITLSKYCRLAEIHRKTGENILASFVAIGMLEMTFSETGNTYRLSDQYLTLTPEQREEKMITLLSKHMNH
ncbi:MAG TPA: ATP-binding protein [Bacteroidales bacterium]|nr:ATP-binding protein [Bacteroidales bacterium]